MTYEETLQYIHSVSWRGSRLGLHRVQELCARLGDPQKQLRCVHIAGTNGKGSVSAMLASIFRHAGMRMGLFTSPYVYAFNERMQIDGEPISDDALTEIVEALRPHADAMEDPPTEFELITVAAFLWFAKEQCDIVVLEAGLGGRLDATNVIESPAAAVITGIGLDHTDALGSTTAEIAAEKAGILKRGCPVILGECDDEAREVIRDAAVAAGAVLYPTDVRPVRILEATLEGTKFAVDWRRYETNLLGVYQPKNAAVAIRTAQVLGMGEEDIRAGVAQVRWPARFEILQREPLIIFDGGHNPQGVSTAVETVRALLPGKVDLVTGVMADKDYEAIAENLSAIVENVWCVTPDNPRSLSAEDYVAVFVRAGIPATPAATVAEGVRLARAHAESTGRPLLILGSLYLYKEVRDAL